MQKCTKYPCSSYYATDCMPHAARSAQAALPFIKPTQGYVRRMETNNAGTKCTKPSSTGYKKSLYAYVAQGPPSICKTQATYVESIPSAATRGTKMGHVAPPPYILAPPPPPPRSPQAQQLLILTPWAQSNQGATSEAKATGMAEATEEKLQACMPPP